MQNPVNGPYVFSEGVVLGAIEGVRHVVEIRGWDAPFSVYGLRRVSRGPLERLDKDVETVEIDFLVEGAHPFEDLPGLHLPEEFEAAILVTEGWQYPARLTSAPRAIVELEAMPSSLPDRVENRLLSYLDRSGGSVSLLLSYQDRDTPPEEHVAEGGFEGRVQDAFRRFVGLPVQVVEDVVHILGRFWLGSLLVALDSEPGLRVTDPLASVADPLETFMEPLRDSVLDALSGEEYELDVSRATFTAGEGEAALRRFVLETIARLRWADLRHAALAGALDFSLSRDVLLWCDAGMLSRLVSENVSTQRELLDAILHRSPILANEALEELERRGWLEPAPDSWDRGGAI
jgi:hypothetical protein